MVEWAKTYARANRFGEEVELVLEEMRRTQRYFAWRCSWWLQREDVQTIGGCNSELITSGRRAYARKQVSIYTRLASKFVGTWERELERNELSIDLLKIN